MEASCIWDRPPSSPVFRTATAPLGSLRLCSRLVGAGGRKKIFRLNDVIKPLADAQKDKLKLAAVKRILRSEKAVACSGAAHVSRGRVGGDGHNGQLRVRDSLASARTPHPPGPGEDPVLSGDRV